MIPRSCLDDAEATGLHFKNFEASRPYNFWDWEWMFRPFGQPVNFMKNKQVQSYCERTETHSEQYI